MKGLKPGSLIVTMVLLLPLSGLAAPLTAKTPNASVQTAHMAEVRTLLELHHLERTLMVTNQGSGDLPPHKKSAIRHIDAAIKELKLQLLSERGVQPMNRTAAT